MTEPSNWQDALRRGREQQLACPKCGAENQRRATIIELDEQGTAVCGVCAHAWRP